MSSGTQTRTPWAARNPLASWTITLLVAAALVFGFGRFRTLLSGAGNDRDVQTTLTIGPDALDFGERLEGQPFSWDLHVTNTSDRLVEVARVDTSCNCAGVEPKTLTLKPGETRTLRLLLDLHDREGDGADQASHEIVLTAHLFGQEGRPYAWTVRGLTRRFLDVRPGVCDFREELHEGLPTKPVQMTIRPRIPVRDVTAEGPAGWMVGIRHDGKQYHMEVRPPAGMRAGPIKEVVKLRSIGLGGENLPAIDVSIRGEVIGEVESVPGEVLLGAMPVGSASPATLMLRSRRDLDVQIVRTAPGPGIEIKSVRGNSVEFECVAAGRGDGQSFVEVVARLPDGRERKLRTDVSYYGY